MKQLIGTLKNEKHRLNCTCDLESLETSFKESWKNYYGVSPDESDLKQYRDQLQTIADNE